MMQGRCCRLQTPVENRLGYILKRVQHALRTRMDRDLSQCGLSAAGYAVLCVLESRPGLSNAELARRCFVRPQTMVRIVAGLEAGGLLCRTAHPAVGRALPAELTGAGQQVLKAAHRAVEAIEDEMVAGLDEQERSRLCALLSAIAEDFAPLPRGTKRA